MQLYGQKENRMNDIMLWATLAIAIIGSLLISYICAILSVPSLLSILACGFWGWFSPRIARKFLGN